MDESDRHEKTRILTEFGCRSEHDLNWHGLVGSEPARLESPLRYESRAEVVHRVVSGAASERRGRWRVFCMEDDCVMLEAGNFLAEIKASPDLDEPRLIFADWLEERGDPLGEFIRLQCLRAGDLSPQHRSAAAIRAEDLQRRFGHQWIGFNAPKNFHIYFRRGFPEVANLSGPVFVGPNGHRVLQIEMLRDLRIDGWHRSGQGITQVLGRPGFRAQLDCLRVANCGLSIWEVRKLVRLPLLRRVRHLDLSWNRSICAGCIAELARSQVMDRLELLDIHGTCFGRDTIEAVLSEPALDRLKLLIISRVQQRDFKAYENRLQQKFGDRIEYR